MRPPEGGGKKGCRASVGHWVESKTVQGFVIITIILNAAVLGLETSKAMMDRMGFWLVLIDKICLGVFVVEIVLKLFAYRIGFWRNGWNVFDFFVVAVALIPDAGAWSVLRALRVLRVFRLLTVVPQLRKVVAAFLHAIPGLTGVMLVMAIFFYTAGVLATNLFGEAFPQWFGSLGRSWFTLFQIMTLESWSMGIVRPVMDTFPWAWAFFVPFIVIATFTILNLFIGIIVSTMQELATIPDLKKDEKELFGILDRLETDLADLRKKLRQKDEPGPGGGDDQDSSPSSGRS